ncbi:hypothetical protein SETIT_2G080400v2 [Setaria italica]|uniref:Protein kinase domain-containing protein n=1 Tax=Setaria italica TaxID=4555 RepID=A0A368PWM8_SETIT|nr:hypothetical protein SETIT_2G080400v2 [Setaria italica]
MDRNSSPTMLLLRIRRRLQLLLLLSAMATTKATATSSSSGHAGYERALVAFKAKISSQSGVLASWNKSTSYCSWEGVTCGKRHRWRVVALDLSFQGLAGTISPAIGTLTFLQSLNLSFNGPISLPALAPSAAFRKTRCMAGRLPSDLGKSLPSIQQLAIGTNLFTGALPRSLNNLSQLQVFDVDSNNFTGVVPTELGRLQNLEVFMLDSNKFHANNEREWGFIASLTNCSRFQKLTIGWNRFSGNLPSSLANVSTNLQWLRIPFNQISGATPLDVGNLAGLEVLDFSGNLLSGVIPESIGKLTQLKELFLYWNNFSGVIPSSIGNLTGLWRLGALGNSLERPIPLSIGNLSKLTVPSLSINKLTGFVPKEIMGLSSTLAILGLSYNFLEGPLPLEVDRFSEANVLGKGRYGTVYRGILENEAIVVAVKVFNIQHPGLYKSFQAECEALRRVRHRCLVKIITCCSSINHQGQDFRALVFEFMVNRSLDRWIHSNFEGPNGQGALTLSQRLDIAVDIVDALDYLHNGCQPPVIHCDLKPSNILLNQDLRARIGDFGIAKVLDESTSKHPVKSNSFIGIRGSIGYIAPGALPDKVMEIADSNIWLHDGANNRNDATHITITKKCLSALSQLGVLCSKQLPIERLSMSDATAEMHAIRDTYFSTQQ